MKVLLAVLMFAVCMPAVAEESVGFAEILKAGAKKETLVDRLKVAACKYYLASDNKDRATSMVKAKISEKQKESGLSHDDCVVSAVKDWLSSNALYLKGTPSLGKENIEYACALLRYSESNGVVLERDDVMGHKGTIKRLIKFLGSPAEDEPSGAKPKKE